MNKRVSIYQVNGALLFGVLVIIILYFGRPFLVPLAFAIVLSMLFMPVSHRLERWGISRISATLLCILLLLVLIAGFCGVIYAQAVTFSNDWPQIKPKLQDVLHRAQEWVHQRFGLTAQEQISSLKAQVSKLSSSSGQSITAAVGALGGLLTSFVLVVLYMFFLMWKREKFRDFFLKLAAPENRSDMRDSLDKITEVSAQYLTGRLISMLFLAAFYAIGLSIVGLENAIMASIIAVIPTLIPYIGAFIGATFPLGMAFLNGSPDMLLPTIAILVGAQIIDNNIIEPLVMGNELDLSPIFTIIAVVAGELIWGIPGMILFEPLFAIIRIVCEHIPALHPYSFLLSNELEEPQWVGKMKQMFSKIRS
ncbi:AI-2E family transporter [Fibrisoma montanum]|uniref:AI-2E family transporter n=1 Tax=Fibrisoma montanum TaxID=2305895 RepID=A0A418M8N4_9BACT|nr:AI-2E family transporter [Fibrisoma montanum]RIV22450.1 AI-2E family transporter [Fibrisoma montanum]